MRNGGRGGGAPGFTLIEILVVLVLIGILAVIAIPSVSSVRETTYVAAMKSDLRNLAALQAGYYTANDAYALTVPSTDFSASDNVELVIDSATVTGWGAHATHPGTPVTCLISGGVAGDLPPTCE